MELREKIVKIAGDLFISEGIRHVTMDRIANAVGISKRTVYENYKDKNDLLSNFLITGMLSFKKQTLHMIKDADNVIDALFRFSESNRKIMKNINPLFFEDLKKYHSNVANDVMNNHSIRNREISYTILKKGVNEGTFIKSIDIDLANEFIHNVMEFFHKKDICGEIDHIVFWNTVHLPYLKGICTEKGHLLLNSFLAKHENYNH